MPPWFKYLIGALGLALLMIVHEGGHFFAARAYGMRVIKFSIGFGPTIFKIVPEDGHYWFTTAAGKVRLRLWKHVPEKHGPTVFQVAAIPFLAYVQIAGMNPLEEVDPKDKGSYANASVTGRIAAIFAGPLANYVFAALVFFGVYAAVGRHVERESTIIGVLPGKPAMLAGFKDGDQVVNVAGVEVSTWSKMAENISKHPAEKISVDVMRKGERVTITVTPANEEGKGRIGVGLFRERIPMTMKEAAIQAFEQPAMVVAELFINLKKWVHEGSVKELGGPKAMVEQTAAAAEGGWADFIEFLAALSAYLGAFNLIPFPALDGGRLIFLTYEAATRRRANPRIEAVIHGVGLIMLLGLMGYVTVFNDILGKK
ncbi:MAG: site-2 protease family protein [Polyangiaceae bacterium]|nr:site-2 protease family protein [Polyangiaceae bacterium]